MKKRILSALLACLFLVALLPSTALAVSGIDSVLTDGKLYVPAVEPTTEFEAYDYINWYLSRFWSYEYELTGGPTQNLDEAIISYSPGPGQAPSDVRTVEVVYAEGDPAVSARVKRYSDAITPMQTFKVTDLEIINFWLHAGAVDASYIQVMANYSGELREYMDNANISVSFETATGMGEDAELFTSAMGDGVFIYDGIAYAAGCYPQNGPFGSMVEHIIYVPDGTPDTRNDLIAAAQARINEYVGNSTDVVLSFGGAFSSLSDPDANASVLGVSGIDDYYIATIGSDTYKLLIIPDSDKMLTPSLATYDIKTNVSITADSATVPIDATVTASNIDSGEEYDRIIGLLGVDDNSMYDIKLSSETYHDYITLLEDGTFEVRIPIPENLEDKDLKAYYIDEMNNIIPYDVTIDGEFAVFHTDHFSVYTLANVIAAPGPAPISNPSTSADSFALPVVLLAAAGLCALCLLRRKVSAK